MPVYNNNVNIRAAAAYFAYPSTRERCDVIHATFGCSLLGRSFSTLWAQALNNAEKGLVTHFAMIHSDVGASRNWLDVLLEEMEAHQADVCAAVIPIKDMKGITSTAIQDPQNPWQPKRRLTMSEIIGLKDVNGDPLSTFDAVDLHRAGLNPDKAPLLVNTGLWICDLRKPWVLGDWTQNAPIHMTINDRMHRNVKKEFVVDTEPEDWYFSRQAAHCGAKIIATRKVEVEHFGEISWSNKGVWGEWTHDEEILGPVPPEKASILMPDPGDDNKPAQADPIHVQAGEGI
jgi:hypothetical protein